MQRTNKSIGDNLYQSDDAKTESIMLSASINQISTISFADASTNPNGKSKTWCKNGMKCIHVREFNCPFRHAECIHGIECGRLKNRECGYYHPKEHFDAICNDSSGLKNEKIPFAETLGDRRHRVETYKDNRAIIKCIGMLLTEYSSGRKSLGTGTVFSVCGSTAYIITCAHVVTGKKRDPLQCVTFLRAISEKKEKIPYKAKIVGIDAYENIIVEKKNDLAILEIVDNDGFYAEIFRKNKNIVHLANSDEINTNLPIVYEIYGYPVPGGKQGECWGMRSSFGSFNGIKMKVTKNKEGTLFDYNADDTFGIYGVHTLGGSKQNHGVALTPNKIKWINDNIKSSKSSKSSKLSDAVRIRKQWKVGSKVRVYSRSKRKWFKGDIIGIFIDNEGEWLNIQYTCGSGKDLAIFPKQLPRDHKHVIPLSYKLSKAQIKLNNNNNNYNKYRASSRKPKSPKSRKSKLPQDIFSGLKSKISTPKCPNPNKIKKDTKTKLKRESLSIVALEGNRKRDIVIKVDGSDHCLLCKYTFKKAVKYTEHKKTQKHERSRKKLISQITTIPK